jgi:hypothetical protein
MLPNAAAAAAEQQENAMSNRPRFQLRRSKVDGMFRRWEQRLPSDLGIREGDEDDLRVPEQPVWVVTAVYRTRREAFVN